MYWIFKNFMNRKDRLIYYFGLIINIPSDIILRIWPVVFIGKIIDEGLMKNDYQAMTKYFLLSVFLYAILVTIAHLGLVIMNKITFNKANLRAAEAIYEKINYRIK